MRLGQSAFKEFLRRSKGVRLKPGSTQQAFKGAAEARVILDDADRAFVYWHASCQYLPSSHICRPFGYCPFAQIASVCTGFNVVLRVFVHAYFQN